jgi:hypothetical protein
MAVPVGFVLDKVALDRIMSGQFGLPIAVKHHLYGLIWKMIHPYAENPDNFIFL